MLIASANPQNYPWLLFLGVAIIALVLVAIPIKLLNMNFFSKKEHHDMDDSPWENLMGEKNDKNKRN